MSGRDMPIRRRGRRKIRWDSIEREYRAGQLTLTDIARMHGINRTALHNKIKALGWTRDLESEMRKRVAVRLRAPAPSPEPERAGEPLDPIELAAERAIHVVRSHRVDIARLRRIAESLARRIEDTLHIEGEEGAPTVGGRDGLDAALVRLAQVTARVIMLERAAFGLDERAKPAAVVQEEGDGRSDEDKRRELSELVGAALGSGAEPGAPA